MEKVPLVILVIKKISTLFIWFVFALCILGGVVVLSSNLFFLWPKGRAFIAGKITQKTRVPVHLESIQWIPGKGFFFQGVEVPALMKGRQERTETPSVPSCHVLSLQCVPRWSSLWKKRRLEVSEIVLDGVEGAVSIEQIQELLETLKDDSPVPAKGDPSEEPLLAQVEHEQGSKGDLEKRFVPESDSSSQPASLPQKRPNKKEPSEGTSIPNTPLPPGQPPLKGCKKYPNKPSILIRWNNVTCSLYSEAKTFPPVEVLSGKGSVPLFGMKKRHGFMDFSYLENTHSFPLEWNEGVLSLSPSMMTIQGNLVELSGSLTPQKQHLFELSLKSAPTKEKTISFQWKTDRMQCDIEQLNFGGKIKGLLKHPVTWVGGVRAVGHKIRLNLKQQGLYYEFEKGEVLSFLKKKQLRIPQARLYSEEFSVLGNARMTASLKSDAVIRLVSSVENKKKLQRLGFVRDSIKEEDILIEFGGPDRYYRDFLIRSRSGFRDSTLTYGLEHPEKTISLPLYTVIAPFMPKESK